MHTYTLTITKDDFLLEFKSTDKYIVEKELGIWITSAAELLEQMPEYKEPEVQEPKFEKIELGRIDLNRQKVQEPARVEEPVIKELPPLPEVMVQPKPLPQVVVTEEKQHHSYKISDETKEILQRAIHKPTPTMNEVLNEEKIQKPEPVKINIQPQSLPPAPRQLPPLPAPLPPPIEPIAPQEDFTAIFNQKVVQEHSNTDKFAQLLSLQNIHNKFDCLIACAYHLIERENFERFTLKQVNTLSKALLEEAIEHDTLKEALERRFIKIVPDYTGIATTMEYTLTENGTRYFEQEIAG